MDKLKPLNIACEIVKCAGAKEDSSVVPQKTKQRLLYVAVVLKMYQREWKTHAHTKITHRFSQQHCL